MVANIGRFNKKRKTDVEHTAFEARCAEVAAVVATALAEAKIKSDAEKAALAAAAQEAELACFLIFFSCMCCLHTIFLYVCYIDYKEHLYDSLTNINPFYFVSIA